MKLFCGYVMGHSIDDPAAISTWNIQIWAANKQEAIGIAVTSPVPLRNPNAGLSLIADTDAPVLLTATTTGDQYRLTMERIA